jgi:hypothetical protein
MKTNEIETFNCLKHEIQTRWPLWTPNPAETADWLDWLADFGYAAVAKAARMHLAESRYAKPMPYQLLEHARRFSPSKPKPAARQVRGVPETLAPAFPVYF